ncbi:MAG: hypothetical protein NVS1B14_02660 [Vulcanimicrobiaceae bacterium]
MNDFTVLAGLDYARARNHVRSAVRSPGRLIVWALYVAWIVVMVFLRSGGAGGAAQLRGIAEPYASLTAFAALALLVGAIAIGARGRATGFVSTADARFLISSHLNPRLVTLWLQLRNYFRFAGRIVFVIVLYTMIFNRAGSIRGISLSLLLGASLAGTVLIPSLALARRVGKRLMTWATAALEAGLLACLAILALQPLGIKAPALRAAAAWVQHAGLGRVLNDLLRGDLAPLALLFAASLCMVLAAFFCGADLYPELCDASQRLFERRDAVRSLARGHASAAYETQPGTTARFSGAWTGLWKEWIRFKRSRGSRITLALGIVFWAAVGVATVPYPAGKAGPEPTAVTILAVVLNFIAILSATTAVTLAADVRKPIWWLSGARLSARLFVWTLAVSWRMSLGCVLAFAICAAADRAHAVLFLAGGLIVSIVFPVIMRAVGLATYAILPAPADQRGPLAMLRMLLTYVLLAPPAMAFLLMRFFAGNVAAVAAGVAIAAVQVVVLVEFSAWRMDGNGSAYALAESA